MSSLISMDVNFPKEPSRALSATNSYFTYAKPKRVYKRKAPVKRTYQRKPRVAVSSNMGARGLLRSSPCVTDYVMAIANPFDAPAGACLPADSFPLPSQKIKSFSRGTCVLGTTGYGFIIASIVMAYDAVSWTATTSTSVMAASTAASAVTNTITGVQSSIPFSIADVSTNNLAQGRGVALGIRARYTGTEAGRNGIINCVETQDHVSLAGFSYNFVRTHPGVRTERPNGDGDWTSALYSGPTNPAELTFNNVPILSGKSGVYGPPLGMFISGVAGDTYEFEVFQHIEAIGDNTSGKTLSHNDAQGFAKAQEATKAEAASSTLGLKDNVKLYSSYINHLVESLPFVVETGSNIARALSGNPVKLIQQITGHGMTYIPPARPQARLEL